MPDRKVGGILFICGLAAIALGVMGYFGIDLFVKYFGQEENAVVTSTPFNCFTRTNNTRDRDERKQSPHITVDLYGEVYDINISEAECLNGKYHRGSIVKLKKHPSFKRIVLPNSYPEIALLPLLLPVFFVIAAIRKK